MDIKSSEITNILKKQIKNLNLKQDVAEVGQVLSVGDGIARIYGLENVQAGEMIEFPGGVNGMALNLEDIGWKKLNYRWIVFFLFVAILNEIVWRTQSEIFWINFKVWGLLLIGFLFAASQVPLINKYKLKQ